MNLSVGLEVAAVAAGVRPRFLWTSVSHYWRWHRRRRWEGWIQPDVIVDQFRTTLVRDEEQEGSWTPVPWVRQHAGDLGEWAHAGLVRRQS
jgi:hypothetical protein